MASSTSPIAIGDPSEGTIRTVDNNGNVDIMELQCDEPDLRLSKGELFNKLVGDKETQQMIVSTSNKLTTENGLSIQNLCSNGNSNKDQSKQTFNNESDLNDNTNHSNMQEHIFSRIRNRWYTNDEVASILTNFSSHPEWQTNELQVRPKSGAVLLYSREKVRYRQDGYCWKKRKNGRTTREDHMKLKVQGIECIYGCYVHSAILPTFHRRCYWLLENPDIVLVHYLNQPPDDQNKMILTFNSSVLEADTRRAWTNEEIIEEIGSVFGGISQIHHTLNINFPTTNGNNTTVQQIQPSLSSSQSSQQQKLLVNEDRTVDLGSSPVDGNYTNGRCDNEQSSTNEDKIKLEKTQTKGDYSNTTKCSTNVDSYIQDDNKCEHRGDESINTIITYDNGLNANVNCVSTNDDEMITQDTLDRNNQKVEQEDSNNMCDEQQKSDSSDNGGNQQRLYNKGSIAAATASAAVTNMTYNFTLDPVCSTATAATATTPSMANVDDLKNLDDPRTICEQSSSINDALREHLMDQSSCSPVTQIYNKIVDDIETYALPIEPDHFRHHHHHDHGVQSMELGESSSNEDTTLAGRQTQRSSNDSDLIQGHHLNNHNQLGNSVHDTIQSSNSRELDLNREQSDCSVVDLVSCDLFGDMDHDDSDQRVGDSRGDDMLLTEFNLPGADSVTSHVNDEILGGPSHTVDNLNRDDDLRDLMMGISGGNDANSLDLFNFKPSNFDRRSYHNQLDVKSTTSETDTLNRLSPMANMVPRCNSTDNALQSSLQRLEQHQYQHHLSNHYLTDCAQAGDFVNSFSQFHHHQNFHQNQQMSEINCNNFDHHRSTASSTNPSNSTSCSPSPSSSSLIASGVGFPNLCNRGGVGTDGGQHSVVTRSNDSNRTTSHHCSTNTSPNNGTFMKLPLQQRQHSEQKEPSNSVLSSLLPKALSLDGSDLSTTSGHHQLHNHHHHQNHHQHHVRGLTSPLVGAHSSVHNYRDPRSPHNHSLHLPNSNDNNGQQHQQQQSRQHFNTQQQISMTPQHMCNRAITNRSHLYQRPSVPSLPSQTTTTLTGNYPSDTTNRMFLTINQHRSGSIAATTSSNFQQQCGHLNNMEYLKMQQQTIVTNSRLLPVLDYVPNWSISTGGTKLLIIGDWSNIMMSSDAQLSNKPQFSDDMRSMQLIEDKFYALFDEMIVPATIIQSNVLRCYAPAHEPGFVALRVVYKNVIISEQVLFEMRSSSSSDTCTISSSGSAVTPLGM